MRLRTKRGGLSGLQARLGLADYVELGPAGIRPHRRRPVLIPGAAIERFSVDRWTSHSGQATLERVCVSAHLIDGRVLMLPALSRPISRGSRHIQVVDERGPRLLSETNDRPLAWSSATDHSVITALQRMCNDVTTLKPGDPESVATIDLRGLQDHGPPVLIDSLPKLIRSLRPRAPRYREWRRRDS